MHNASIRLLTALFLLTTSSAAFAHPGHDISGFAAGALHPVTGLDHLLAMQTVGIWAATLGGSAQWKTPTTFVALLLTGAVLGMSGIQLPLVEPFSALSVLLLGLAVTLTLRIPATAAFIMVGLFALVHGHAHGSEMTETASSYYYLLGITLASLALHLTGLAIGHALMRHTWLLRSSGAMIAGVGVWMVAAL